VTLLWTVTTVTVAIIGYALGFEGDGQIVVVLPLMLGHILLTLPGLLFACLLPLPALRGDVVAVVGLAALLTNWVLLSVLWANGI
jgi:hypothetical protein